MKKTYQVFISGTYTDLKQEREAAERALAELGLLGVSMPFPASKDSGPKIKREESLRKLESCDAMVLILGGRYGEPDLAGDPRSITEVEFDWAEEHKLPCYVFIKEPWSSNESDSRLKIRHEKFKEIIDNQKLRASFGNDDKLKYEINRAFTENPIEQEVFGKPFHSHREFFSEELSDSAPPHTNLKHELLCRSKELQKFQEFSISQIHRILAIVGGQGLGKSKLLLEWSSKAPPDHKILFLNQLAFSGKVFDKDTIDQLPKTDNLFVVFDDAHEIQSLDNAVLQILIAHPNVKIITSGRPNYEYSNAIEILADRKTRFPQIQINIRPLASDCTDLSEYISKALPQEKKQSDLTRNILRASGGIPWIFHFVIMFIREKGFVPSGLAARDDEFRKFVSDKILGAHRGTISAEVLYWLALIAPANRDRKEWGEIFKKVLKTNDESIVSSIDLWIQEKLLREKGHNLLFTSEIARDFFILELANSKDLPKTIFDHFWNPIFKKILRNLSIAAALDRFDSSGQPNKVSPTFDKVWEKFRSEIIQDSPFGQSQVIEWLEPVAWYQPAIVKDVIEYIRLNPSKKPNPKDSELFHQWTQKDVEEKFPSLLATIAHYQEYFSWACDLLWDYSQKDERQTNPFPEHPMRLLKDIAAYRPRKPIWLTEKIVEKVPFWIKNSAGKSFKHSPIEAILGEALSKEAEFSKFKGHTFSFGAMPIPLELVSNIHCKALGIIFDIIKDQGNTVSAPLVIEAIGELIDFGSGPHKMSMAHFSKEVDEQWIQQSVLTLNKLLDLAKEITFKPIIRYQIWKELEWLSLRGIDSLKKVAIKIREQLEKSPDPTIEFRLYQCSRRDVFENEEAWDNQRNSIAKLLLKVYSENTPLINFLSNVIQELQKYHLGNNDPFLVLIEMAKISPERTLNIAQSIIEEKQNHLMDQIPDLVGPIFSQNEFKEKVRHFIQAHLMVQGMALYGSDIYRRFMPKVLDEKDCDILEKLAASPAQSQYLAFSFSLLDACWRAFRQNEPYKDRLKKLIITIPTESNSKADDHFFMIVTGDEIYPTLSTAEITKIIQRIEKLPKIDDAYWVETFLEKTAKNQPGLITELIKNRLKLETEGKVERALPYLGFERLYQVLRNNVDYESILRQIRDISLSLSGVQMLEIKSAFGSLGGDFGDSVKNILLEWFDGDDSEKFDVAITLLEEGPNSFVLDQIDFVDHLFRRLAQFQGDQHQRRKDLRGALLNMAEHGVTSRTPGTPSTKYQNLFNKCTQIIKEHSGKLCTDTIDFYQSLKDYAERTLHEERLRDEDDFEE